MSFNFRRAGLHALLAGFGILGSLVGRIATSQDAKDLILSKLRRGLNKDVVRQQKDMVNAFDAAGLAQWESKFDDRPAAEISNAMALERNSWVETMARQVHNGALVLDAGAGECQYRHLFQHTVYRAQDFAQYQGTTDGPQSENWRYGRIDYLCDIINIPVSDSTFDVVLCTEVLEHVPDPISTLRELARVTKHGGLLLLSAPLGAGLHQEPFHFYGGFTPHFYKKFLEEFGFSEIQITPLGGLFQHLAQESYRAGKIIEMQSSSDSLDRTLIDPLVNYLPRMLAQLDEKYFVKEFTVGYVVQAKKSNLGDQITS